MMEVGALFNSVLVLHQKLQYLLLQQSKTVVLLLDSFALRYFVLGAPLRPDTFMA